MEWIESFLLFMGTMGLTFVLIGLYKPWIMLWWREKQNRRQIINLYGIIALLCFLIYTTIRFAQP